MKDYKITIGLEVHAELKTKTKMFCNSKNDPDEVRPNVNICPICMGYPGTLPVINKEAVKHVLKMGVALGGKIADFTEFDRKNYFYPDIPKGYQISQYKYPLVTGGELNGVKITRIHLEEDTASSSHDTGAHSLVDFNRAGVPLMELVTEPVIHSAEEASSFAKELQLLLQTIGAGDANMEKGEMRVEANISVSKTKEFGTKVEVKNLNSFKAVEKAIAHEVNRHIELLEKGESVKQETCGWDEKKEVTFSQRTKEDSHDYRYFPDPDLPKLEISKVPEFSVEILKKEIPELPWAKRKKYADWGISKEIADIFVANPKLVLPEEFAMKTQNNPQKLKIGMDFIASSVLGIHRDYDKEIPVEVDQFSNLVQLTVSGVMSSTATKKVFQMMYEGDKREPEVIAEENGLLQKSDAGELQSIVEKIIADNPNVVTEYKSGKVAALQYLVGQGMKATKGSANPTVLQEVIKKLLV